MIIDSETKSFLDHRKNNNAKLHHLLEPKDLREERLRQLKEDNLKPPTIYDVIDLEIQNSLKKIVKLRIYLPKKLEENNETPIIFFFHGGGFVMGNLDTHDFTCRSICIESQMIVCAVDYSLSPEYKFPYAVQEVKDVINYLPQFKNEFSIDVNNVFVCGDSAGGNLAAVLAINSAQKNVIPIRGQILIYPCVDLTLTMRSMDIYLDGMTLTYDTMKYFISHYLNDKSEALNWEASPLFTKKLMNLPEAYIFAAGLDPLLDEGFAYKKRLEYFGNKVTYKLYPGQIHGFLSNSKHFPKALDCIKDIGKAVKLMVNKNE